MKRKIVELYWWLLRSVVGREELLDILDLHESEGVERIVDFWTMQHKEASMRIEGLQRTIDMMERENLAMIAYDPKKVIRSTGKVLKLGDYEITEQETRQLREDAAFLKQSQIWNVMQNTLTELARQNMFENSKDFCDMHKGKATLYDLRAMRNILEEILK